MKAGRSPLIGLLVMVMTAALALPAMAHPEVEVTTDGIDGRIIICLYVDNLEGEEPSPDSPECAHKVMLEWMPEEARESLLQQLIAMAESAEQVNTAMSETEPVSRDYSYSGSVEDWRGLVAIYFNPEDVDHALAIIDCESIGGNPNAVNPSSGASGLFQHMPQYWDERSAKAGFEGADIFDPEANIAVAAWLAYADGWHNWPNCG